MKRVTVKIESLTGTGHGLAHVNGKAVFVSKAVPGDICEIVITHDYARHAFGCIAGISVPGPQRVEPVCPVFGMCGGCSLQMMSYSDQLRAKSEWIGEMWKREGYEIGGIAAAPQELAYRNKAVYQVSPHDIRDTGFFAERTHRIIPHERCYLYPDFFSRVRDSFVEFFSGRNMTRSPFRSLIIRTNEERDQLLLGIATDRPISKAWTDGLRTWAEVVSRRLASLPHPVQVKGLVHLITDRRNPFPTAGVLTGENGLATVINGFTFHYGIESFFQNNIPVFARTVSHMREAICREKVRTAVELYSGVGVISILLHDLFDSMFAIEQNREAAAFGRRNADASAYGKVMLDCCDAEDIWMNGQRDVLIVDPPRSGLSGKVIRTITESLRPRLIVYLSCKPDTLLRDLRMLSANYEVTTAAPYDFFPQTEHTEMLCVLRRR